MTACTGGGPDGEATCPRHGEQPQHLADLEDALAEADADQQWLPVTGAALLLEVAGDDEASPGARPALVDPAHDNALVQDDAGLPHPQVGAAVRARGGRLDGSLLVRHPGDPSGGRGNAVGPAPCLTCGHLTVEHSSEDGLGCLHPSWLKGDRYTLCPCLEPGCSDADQ